MSENVDTLCKLALNQNLGMITIRADLKSPTLEDALQKVAQLTVPVCGSSVRSGTHAGLWMSPDELMLICARSDVPALSSRLADALISEHALVVDMSDARSVFELEGDWRATIARLSPADLRQLGPDQIRRTRMGQIPAALWCLSKTSARVLCFRSVTAYAEKLLQTACLNRQTSLG